MTRPVLILRPEPGASLSVTRAEELGIERVVKVPLFKVRPADWTAPEADRFDAILMTSANAARHGGDQLKSLRKLPVHAVGESTAAAARAAQMMVDVVGTGGIDDLLSALPPEHRLLHLAGAHRRAPSDATQTIVPLTVYTSVARQNPEGFDAARNSVACVHSPRAGRRFAGLVDDHGMDRSAISIVALSDEVAASVGEGWERIDVPPAPNDRDLLCLARTRAKAPE